MEVDLPDVRAEVEAAFARYKASFVANDIAILTALFWDDPRADVASHAAAGHVHLICG
ncbi:MAG: DUF3225 domain-containing protein [Solirubrobacterales bacterium]|nr:DUF3225 domain-containing protein [Solirubrobacterales bacterium]